MFGIIISRLLKNLIHLILCHKLLVKIFYVHIFFVTPSVNYMFFCLVRIFLTLKSVILFDSKITLY